MTIDNTTATTTITTTKESAFLQTNDGASNDDNHDTGILDLSHQNITHRDWKGILTKLGGRRCPAGRDHRPRKCHSTNPSHAQILGRAQSSLETTKIWKLHFAGNRGIGDEGMNYLAWIPDSVCDLDVSDCGLTCQGITTLCQFLANNKTLTRVVFGGGKDGMDDEAAKAVGQMLAQNDTLQELSVNPPLSSSSSAVGVVRTTSSTANSVSPNDNNSGNGNGNTASTTTYTYMAAIKVGMGLHKNRTLRHLRFPVRTIRQNSISMDEGIWYLMFSKLLPDDSPLETLDCGAGFVGGSSVFFTASSTALRHDTDTSGGGGGREVVMDDSTKICIPSSLHPLLENVYDKWLDKLERNEHLHWISGENRVFEMFHEPLPQEGGGRKTTQYYLDLNKYHARRVVRDPQTSSTSWLDSMTRASEDNKLNAIYYMIRNKPEVLDGRQWQ